MLFSPLKLDVDLKVDRTKIVQPDDLILIKPEFMRIQSTYRFEIENYVPEDEYEITFTYEGDTTIEGFPYGSTVGTWVVDLPYIDYTTPFQFDGMVKLRIVQKKAPFRACVIFEDGTLYNEYGEISKATVDNEGKYRYDSSVCDYEVDSKKNPVEKPSFPFPTTLNTDEQPSVSFKDYNPSKVFGDLGSSKFVKEEVGKKNGFPLDYYLPAEENKGPNETKYIYDVTDDQTKVVFVPRNSNVQGAGGDVLVGYGTVGGVGGSLTVTKGPDQLNRTFEWDIRIKLQELEAILPDEIISMCITDISFSPVLKGISTGHFYEWEQIAGDQSSVVWLTPKDQLEVVIDLGGLKVDRVFRFWISRGTEYERYYDIYLYGTPFDRVKNIAVPGEPFFVGQPHLNIKTHECTPIVLTYQNIYHKQLRINVVRNY